MPDGFLWRCGQHVSLSLPGQDASQLSAAETDSDVGNLLLAGVQLKGRIILKKSSIGLCSTLDNPYNSRSVTVLLPSSMRDMEPRQYKPPLFQGDQKASAGLASVLS